MVKEVAREGVLATLPLAEQKRHFQRHRPLPGLPPERAKDVQLYNCHTLTH